MSTIQRAVMLCGWAVKAGMVRLWVASKTVWSQLTWAIFEQFRDEVLYNKTLYKSILLYFTFILVINPAVGCHNFPPGPWLPSQLKSITAARPVSNYTAWWQGHTSVNSLPKATTWWCQPGLEPMIYGSQVRCPTNSPTVAVVQGLIGFNPAMSVPNKTNPLWGSMSISISNKIHQPRT